MDRYTPKEILFKRLKDIVNSKNGILLSTEYKTAKTKYKIKCKNGHIFEMTADKITGRGDWCPYCSGRYGNYAEQFKKLVEQRNGQMIGSYINSKKPIECICEKGHHFKICLANLKAGKWCKKCHSSRGEEIIKNFLENYNISFIREYTFSNLKGKKKLLPFDFAVFINNQLFCLIEFQGEQHYKPYRIASKNILNKFKAIQETDKLKKEYCKKNNIELLEISTLEIDDSWYKYMVRDINKILLNFFIKKNIIKI